MFGGRGDDKLVGDVGHDRLYGGDGDDRLAGNAGADRLDGGAGDDALNVCLDEHIDEVHFTGRHFGHDNIKHFNALQDKIFIHDFSFWDIVATGGSTPKIYVGQDNKISFDKLKGQFNAVKIFDRDGNRVPVRQDEEKIYLKAGDIFNNGSGHGYLTYQKPANESDVGVFILGGDGHDLIRGGPENDRLEGGADNDILIGMNGEDILIGGPGNDVFLFEDADWVASAFSKPGRDMDTIDDFASGDRLVFTAATFRALSFEVIQHESASNIFQMRCF